MGLTLDQKKDVLGKFSVHPTDTGSPEVQIALLSERIKYLTEHFKTHAKDHHSRQGTAEVGRSTKAITGLPQEKGCQRYRNLIQELGIQVSFPCPN